MNWAISRIGRNIYTLYSMDYCLQIKAFNQSINSINALCVGSKYLKGQNFNSLIVIEQIFAKYF